ncbi:RDD family protein [Cellulomonas hominis]
MPDPPRPGAGGPLDVAPVRPDQVAGIGVRVGALLLDQLLVCLVVTVAVVVAVAAVGGDDSPGAGLLLVPGALGLLVGVGQWVAEARTGATLGSRLLGIRTLSARTGLPAGLLAILLRQVVLTAGSVVVLVGTYVVAASGTWDASPSRRGWHDKAAGTMVLRAGSASPASRRAAALGATRPPAPPAARPATSGVPQPWSPPTEAVPPPPAPAAPSISAVAVAPPPPPPPATTTSPVLGALELTRAVPREPAPVPDALQAAPAPAPSRLRLVFDTGEVVDVEGAGLVGRNPQPGPGVDVAHTVAIADPERSVSKVHLEFAPDGDGLVVVDRGSTNGTVVVDPQGRGRSLAPGVRARLEVGWLVLFGDRSFLIEQR